MRQMVRLKVVSHHADKLRQLQHLAYQRKLRLMPQQRHITGFPFDAALFRKTQDAGYSGMGVLDVIDRVLL